MRITWLRPLAVPLVVALAIAVLATPAAAKSKAPVRIPGAVNNKGVTTVKHGKADLEVDDFSFEKTFLKTAPGAVTIELTNKSSTLHTFTVDGQGIDETLQPGAKTTVTVTVAAGAPTVFYCRFHKTAGMQGALFTKTGAVATARTHTTGPSSAGYGS